MKNTLLFSFLILCLGAAGQPVMVKNIGPDQGVPTRGSNPYEFVAFKGRVVFKAIDELYEEELFVTDGTPQGTNMLFDINPGDGGSSPRTLTVVGDRLFFKAYDASGLHLWVTDGTPGNLVRLTAAPVFGGGTIIGYKGQIYFTNVDAVNGFEIWRSDGTPQGTGIFADLNPGIGSSVPNLGFHSFGVANDLLFFSATNGANGTELWKTDGTAANTTQVTDIRPGAGDAIDIHTNMFTLQNTLYFIADDGTNGREVWRTDGTVGNTTMVKNQSGSVAQLNTVWNGKLYYSRFDGNPGRTTYEATDGTATGTFSMALGATNFNVLKPMGDRLYFIDKNQSNEWSLWRTDGTQGGETLVKSLGAISRVMAMGATSDRLLFALYNNDVDTFTTLWSSDGTTQGTASVSQLIADFYSQEFFSTDEAVYIGHDEAGTGKEPWKFTGKPNGSMLLADINKQSDIVPEQLTVIGETVFFRTSDNVSGFELWKSDGTESGTVLLKDINPGADGSGLTGLTQINGILLFAADDGTHGMELWRSDGTAAGTYLVKDIKAGADGSNPGLGNKFVILNNIAYFPSTEGELWKTDGTAQGTSLVKTLPPNTNIENMVATGTHLFFLNGMDLWKSDGTDAGTIIVKDLRTQPTGNFMAGGMIASDDKVFLVVDDGANGAEPWVSDGTPNGTNMIKNIHTGTDQHFTSFHAVHNGIGYFYAAGGNGFDYEIWRTDGTEANTYVVKDIFAGPTTSNASFIGKLGSDLYYQATDAVRGKGLWKTNGTDAGTLFITTSVTSVGPFLGLGSGASVSNRLYFTGRSASIGSELFRTDGSAAGTVLVADIVPGYSSSNISQLVTTPTKLFFTARDAKGVELWVLDPATQKIKFDPLAAKTVNDAPFGLTATTTWDLPVSFSIESGPATISGNVVTITGAGTVVIKASQPGNGEVQPAAPVLQSFVVSKAPQTISFTPVGNRAFSDVPFGLSASSSSNNPIAFLVASGPATLSGSMVTLTGTGVITLVAEQAEDEYYANARVEQSFTVSKGDQQITFGEIASKTMIEQPVNLTASSSSKLPVQYVVTGPATLNGSSLSFTAPGTITIKATQPGNANYNAAADVERTFSVTKANQTITFSPIGTRNSNDPPFQLTATASSALPVQFQVQSGPASVTGSTLTITGAGVVVIRAIQTGNNSYNEAQAEQSFTVNLFVGLNDETQAVQVYPNPASSTVVVNVPNALNYKTVSLLDSLGRDVLSREIEQQQVVLNVEKLPRGVYFVRLAGNQSASVTRILLR